MGQAIEIIARIALWVALVVTGIGISAGWWTLETETFQGLVLAVLSVLVIRGAG